MEQRYEGLMTAGPFEVLRGDTISFVPYLMSVSHRAKRVIRIEHLIFG